MKSGFQISPNAAMLASIALGLVDGLTLLIFLAVPGARDCGYAVIAILAMFTFGVPFFLSVAFSCATVALLPPTGRWIVLKWHAGLTVTLFAVAIVLFAWQTSLPPAAIHPMCSP